MIKVTVVYYLAVWPAQDKLPWVLLTIVYSDSYGKGRAS